jgi:hypothetical protein
MELTTHLGFFKQSWWISLLQLILPSRKLYWKENHWRWNAAKTSLEGRFRTPYCAPLGRMERHPDGTFDFYIYDPPEKLWTHPTKKNCFEPIVGKKGVYHIHFSAPRASLTIDGCIIEVERTLVEAFEHRS